MTLENDILERLRNGEDAEQIAQELINNLNNAIATKDKEDAEAKRVAEEKAKAEQALEDKKNNLANAMARAMLEYYRLTLPEVPEGIAKELNGSAVRKQLDSTVDLLKSLVDLSNTLDKIDFSKIDMNKVESKLENLFGLTPVSKKNGPKTSYEDAINSFFRANGL